MDGHKQCSKCGEVKPVGEFHMALTGEFGVRGNCRKCVAAWSKKHREANKEEIAAKRLQSLKQQPRESIRQSEQIRFWEKVYKEPGENACWLWEGKRSKGRRATDAYGQFCIVDFETGKQKIRYVHRYAYEISKGLIPEELEIDHACNVTTCVNPDHLDPVTPQENVRRSVRRGTNRNIKKMHCPKGHPYSGENLYIRPDLGGRGCRTCMAQHDLDKRQRREEKKMRSKSLLVLSLVVILFVATPAHGQIAVYDVEANPTHWKLQLIRMITIINDLIVQARLGKMGDDGSTGGYLNEQADVRYGEAITYGSESSEIFNEVFTFDESYPEGNWLEANLDTERRALDTQRTMLRLLERRHEEFAEDEATIDGLVAGVNGARGRNSLMPAMAQVALQQLQEERKTQQLLLTLTNSVLVANARQVDQEQRKAAQERFFLTNGEQEVAKPQFIDRGL